MHRHRGNPPRRRRIDGCIGPGLQHPGDRDTAGPWETGEQQHRNDDRHRDGKPARRRISRTATPPARQFSPDRQTDKKDDFDQKQQEAEHFKKIVIDRQRNPGEQDEPIQPDTPGIGDQDPPAGQPDRFGRRRAWRKQQFTNSPLPECEGPVLEIRNSQSIGQKIIAVKPHEGVEVDRQAHHPAGRRRHEDDAPDGPIRQKSPQQGRNRSEPKFGHDPGPGDPQTFPPRTQPIGVADIRIEHRHHDHQGHTDRGHPASESRCGIGMPQFMHDLDDTQHHAVHHCPLPSEKMQEGRQEGVPLLSHQEQAGRTDHSEQPRRHVRIERRHQG